MEEVGELVCRELADVAGFDTNLLETGISVEPKQGAILTNESAIGIGSAASSVKVGEGLNVHGISGWWGLDVAVIPDTPDSLSQLWCLCARSGLCWVL